jgi:hypothetical protein
VVVDVPDGADFTLGAGTNESYALRFTLDPAAPTSAATASVTATVTATVTAATIFGARHGLETLAQLVEAPAGIIAEAVSIVDAPVYPYRGLMIDTGRHFLPLALIRHAIDGIAAVKMNVLHWHILDSQSFPVASEAFPQLSAAGAFAAAATYTLEELRSVVAYTKQRGVRIVPEFEMPGHGSFSAGIPDLSTTSCRDVLDVTRNSTYVFILAFLKEMASVFDDELIYLGGDEVGVGERCTFNGTRYAYCGMHCFDTDPAVAAWMKAQTPPLTSTELIQSTSGSRSLSACSRQSTAPPAFGCPTVRTTYRSLSGPTCRLCLPARWRTCTRIGRPRSRCSTRALPSSSRSLTTAGT